MQDKDIHAALGSDDLNPGAESAALYRWTITLSARLAHMRLAFHGDLDAFLIFLVFAADTLHRSRLGPRPAETDATTTGMNALSLSEITGIPRETTRRKLQMLIASGFVTRDAEGLYGLRPSFDLDRMLGGLCAGTHRPPNVAALMGRRGQQVVSRSVVRGAA